MKTLIDLFLKHQVLYTYVASTIWTAVVSSLSAPTKDSSPTYVFLFKFMNTIGGNFSRAKSTSLEQSPNFQDAVDKLNKTQPPQGGQ